MKNKIAIIYDFDKTLIPKNMQEYDFQQRLGLQDDFFEEFNVFALEQNMDMILAAEYCFMKIAKEKGIPLTHEFLKSTGKNITYFEGVEGWFDRINVFGRQLGLEIEHYVISCGVKDIVEGCSIANQFTRIFANEFIYDEKGEAVWPKVLLNYTTKTQYLFRIRKNLLDDMYDVVEINKRSAADKIPFTNMIYIGDGYSDVPCMQIIHDKGGSALSVYAPNHHESKLAADTLLQEDRVSASMEADYREGYELDKYIKNCLQTLAERLQK